MLPEGTVVSRRPAWTLLRALIRNPLEALPPEIFSEPIVFSQVNGSVRIHLADPEMIRAALVDHADHLTKSSDLRRALGPALGEGLLTADGAHWRWQRQTVAPAFQHGRLVAMLPAMIAAAEAARDAWLAAPGVVDVGQAMMRTTFAIIVETMLSGRGGIDAERVERAITEYLEPAGWTFVLGLLNAPGWAPYPGRRRAMAAAAYIREAVLRMIAARRAAGAARDDLVALLLEAADPETGRRMTDAEVADNLITFITAGHETTALGLGWSFHLLAGAPEVEARVVAEVAAVTGGEPLLAEHVGRLSYTRQVFAEAMRLFPPAPIIARAVVRPFTLGRYTVPAGAALYVPVYALHRQARLWDEPLAFDPDRFSAEAVRERHRYAYLPFGAGPRVCIGSAFALMEAAAVHGVVLPAVRVRGVEGGAPVPRMRITLRPTRPLRMSVARRC